MTDSPDAIGKSVPAVRRAASILWLLAQRHEPVNLSQIARETDTLPSTALHILRELAAARLIAIDPQQKLYSLGPGLLDIARAIARRSDFAEISRPLLQDIARRFGVTATATAGLDADHNACVASVSPDHTMSLNVTVGGRVPTLAGAAGRCIAAFSNTPKSELRKRFERIRWQQPLDFDAWLAQVLHVRTAGFAEDAGWFARGITTLAAPVFNPDGSVTRAIGIASISAALDAGIRSEIATAIKEAAEKATAQMSI